MKHSILIEYLRLRLLVGYLGEQAQFNWWSTSFFNSSSKLFLEPVFSKTSLLAQYHGIREAARRLHDEHIGVGNVFHLFRLPEEIEQDLHRTMLEIQPTDEMLIKLKDKHTSIQTLTSMTDGRRSVTEGPLAIGKTKDLFTSKAAKELAKCYLAAFEQGTRTYPYLLQ